MADKCTARLVHVHPIVASNWCEDLDHAMRLLRDVRNAISDGQEIDIEAFVGGADALVARVEGQIEERLEEFRDDQPVATGERPQDCKP